MLELRDVSLNYGTKPIVKRVNFQLAKGRVLGLVGPSGAGKSLLSLAILGLLPPAITSRGSIMWNGQSLTDAGAEKRAALRGTEIGMVFQNTTAAFDPLLTIGAQVADLFRLHKQYSAKQARDATYAIFRTVEWPDEIDPFNAYPHEVSGGQRQRALIAIAIALDPALIIADEPTASLDVTTAKSVLDMLRRLAVERGAALLVISHDLPALATCVDDIAHLNHGVINGTHPVAALADATRAPDLAALYSRSVPERKTASAHRASTQALAKISHLTVRHRKPRLSFFQRPAIIEALSDIAFSLHKGECLALVGESGSGKSTLARSMMGIDRWQSGSIMIDGIDPANTSTQIALWKKMRLVFQDPISAMDPNWTVRQIVSEPLALLKARIAKQDRSTMVADIVRKTGLDADVLDRYPHQLSGGQLQRVTLARALVIQPEILILDEPISALDADARGQILDLLANFRRNTGLTILLITHDLGVARAIADRVIVLKAGKIIEEGATLDVLDAPKSDYTKALLAASPLLNARLVAMRALAAEGRQG